jgi:hypothetical protein
VLLRLVHIKALLIAAVVTTTVVGLAVNRELR